MKTFPLADHLVCLEPDSERIQVLNPVAARIVEQHQNGFAPQTIAELIAEDYDVDISVALQDVCHCIVQLENPDGAVLEELESYIPTTDFVPARGHLSKDVGQFHLPGYRINIASEVDGLIGQLADLFCLAPTDLQPVVDLHLAVYDDNGRYPIVSDARTLDTGYTVEDTVIKCLREINGLVARSHAWTIIFHASAVARNNAGVLVPALGGSGKTTLAAYLMSCGYQFLNDDAVPLLSRSAELLPVPVSLSIKSGSWKVLADCFPQLAAIRQYGTADRRLKYLPPSDDQVQQVPVPCRLVIIPDFQPSLQAMHISRMSEVEVFEEIIRSGCIIERPIIPAVLSDLVSWLDGMPCYRLSYSSLVDAEVEIDRLLTVHAFG